MKKFLNILLLLSLALCSLPAMGSVTHVKLYYQMQQDHKDKQDVLGGDHPRSPVAPLQIEQEGHHLTIPDKLLGYDLTLTSTGNATLYGVTVTSTEAGLPESLHGTLTVAESYKEIATGENMSFTNYCEETSLLPAVTPKCLHVYIENASLTLDKINTTSGESDVLRVSSVLGDSIRTKQVEAKAAQINEYNRTHDKLWFAGATELALKDAETKFGILGCKASENTECIEYYDGGIFEFSSSTNGNKTNMAIEATSSSEKFVPEFDWRKRHGIDWTTPAKNQGASYWCVGFATLSSLEALANLYFNKKIDLDLSEQELGCCAKRILTDDKAPFKIGIWYDDAIDYIKENGVCDEEAYPFVNDSNESKTCRSGEITPNGLVKPYNSISIDLTEENIKKSLIKYGPLISGLHTKAINHAMCLIGYKVIQAGDSIRYLKKDKNSNSYILYTAIRIPEGDPRIGKTCFIFKNSYAGKRWSDGRYMYVLFENLTQINNTYALLPPVSTLHYTEEDIVCQDKDGDGYYTWGVGPKPASAPADAPDIQDGDDSNALWGPMDEYGNLESLSPEDRDTIFITSDQTIIAPSHFYSHVVVENDATWTIRANTRFHNGSSVTVRDGGTLALSNQSLTEGVILKADNSANISIQEGATLKRFDGKDFRIPKGARMNIQSGKIR